MIVYNITTKIELSIELAWLSWQQDEMIPWLLATGLFTHYQFYRMLEQDESEGITFVLQLFCGSFNTYKKFEKEFQFSFDEMAIKKWGDQFISYQSAMQDVN